MIAALLAKYGSEMRTKTWSHDRRDTLGSSENGRCARQTAFSKLEIKPDPSYVETWGAAARGDIFEQHFWVPGLLATLPPGVRLLYAGREQQTRVDGYLSATPDGLLVGVQRDCLAYLGVPDIGGQELLVECKSIDPRITLRHAKPEHVFQVQVAMGVLRATTEHRPRYALISYGNASFYNDISEFAVRFEPTVYKAAGERARQIFSAEQPSDLPPEGKMSGGAECKYCAWAEQCVAATVASIPSDPGPILGDNAVSELKGLRDAIVALDDVTEDNERTRAVTVEALKQFMRDNGVRHYRGDNWSVSWGSVTGRSTLDTAAVEAAGIDLSPYKKEGRPGERLVVK